MKQSPAEEFFNKLLVTNKGVEFWYHENFEDGYFYQICAEKKCKQIDIVITEDGVSLDYFMCGRYVLTNIVPKRLFGNKKSLGRNQLSLIIDIIDKIGGEGKSYDTEDMYREWLRQGEP